MTRTASFIIAILITVATQAQVVQRGYVKEYRGEKVKTALPNVEVAVSRAGKTATTADGSFALKFNTAKPGARVSVLRIEKDGYEIFNREALEQWNLNPDEPFVIVMCRSDEFRRLRDRYSEVSSQSYARQKQRDEEALRRKLKDGKQKEDEFRAQLEELRNEYEKKLDNIEEYADRFARIDLSEVSEVERRIVALVERGDLDSAIAVYEEQDYLDKYTQAAVAHQTAAMVEQKLKSSRDSMMAAIHRQADTYRMAGGAENYRKLAALLKGMADADTTNAEAVAQYACFCNDEYNMPTKAKDYYDLALRHTTNPVLKAFLLNMMSHHANNIYTRQEYNEQALKVLQPVLASDSLPCLGLYAYLLDWQSILTNTNDTAEIEQYATAALSARQRLYDLYPDGAWGIPAIGYSQEHQSELASSLQRMADISWRRGDVEQAEQYFKQAVEYMEQVVQRTRKLQYRAMLDRTLGSMLWFCYQNGIDQSAYKAQQLRNMQLMAKTNPDTYTESLLSMFYADSLYQQADQLVQEIIDGYCQKGDCDEQIADIESRAGDAYFLAKRYSDALSHYQQAEAVLQQLHAKSPEYYEQWIEEIRELINASNLATSEAVSDSLRDLLMKDCEDAFMLADERPAFKGDIFEWLGGNLLYPTDCLEQGIEGRVVSTFIIDIDGSIKSVAIDSSPHESLSHETVRIIASMPRWKPGKRRGKPVKVRYTLPVFFQLVE